MTVAGSGASIDVTRRNAPRFADLFPGVRMKSNVAFTSADVTGLPSLK